MERCVDVEVACKLFVCYLSANFQYGLRVLTEPLSADAVRSADNLTNSTNAKRQWPYEHHSRVNALLPIPCCTADRRPQSAALRQHQIAG
jgi:hypothetical protein